MKIPYKNDPRQERRRLIKKHIETVNKTLELVFDVPSERRHRIVTFLKREGSDYWDAALHYLPLYSAASLVGIKIQYPEFDKYEELYAQTIEGQDRQQITESHGGD